MTANALPESEIRQGADGYAAPRLVVPYSAFTTALGLFATT